MSWAELLASAEEIRASAAAIEPGLGGLPIDGIGWATVDAARAFDELGSLFDGAGRWAVRERDALLGSSVWRREAAPLGAAETAPEAHAETAPIAGAPSLFVLEPDTEGRLAAYLARFGEGVAAVYVAGALGTPRIVPVNPRWGPFAVVTSARGG